MTNLDDQNADEFGNFDEFDRSSGADFDKYFTASGSGSARPAELSVAGARLTAAAPLTVTDSAAAVQSVPLDVLIGNGGDSEPFCYGKYPGVSLDEVVSACAKGIPPPVGTIVSSTIISAHAFVW